MLDKNLFHPDLFQFVRGIPVKKTEIERIEQEVGAVLFDESKFTRYSDRVNCAKVIFELDRILATVRKKLDSPDYWGEVDIGNPSYIFVPARFEGFSTKPTPDKPVGIVGWFAVKRHFKGAKLDKAGRTL